MSFILDALRKSEHERQRSAVPGLAQVPLATPPARLPRWALVVIGVLAAAVLVLGGAWWQSTRVPAELAASPPIVERHVELPPAPAPSAERADRVATLRSPAEPTAPPRENALAAAAGPTSTELAAAEPSFGAAPAAPPVTAPDEPALPSAAALLAEGIVLPEMRLELHRFRERPRDRFVFINGRKYVEGERLVEGPQLVSIVPHRGRARSRRSPLPADGGVTGLELTRGFVDGRDQRLVVVTRIVDGEADAVRTSSAGGSAGDLQHRLRHSCADRAKSLERRAGLAAAFGRESARAARSRRS